ncbi:Ankyrin repeat-containing-like protein [Theobroma cacao]|uniref:Ankyrin repeat-containing-like protein n=1 Tax=Theobroma cacao TaxID=3641 RepID=A0A061GMA6_THECC|nr:Ankyrin repeat-containing-like protein [Theobroma cacao]
MASSSEVNADNDAVQDAQRIRHLSQYIPLNKAALKGDRESARRIFDSNPNAIAAGIMEGLSTALHIAVGTGKNIDFVRNLIDLKPVEALELTNDSNSTSLTVAAMVGNLEVARLLVERNPNLPYIRDNNEVVPLHRAVQYGHKNLVSFLLGVTRNEIEPTYPSPYADESGLMLQLLLVFPSIWRTCPTTPLKEITQLTVPKFVCRYAAGFQLQEETI